MLTVETVGVHVIRKGASEGMAELRKLLEK